MTAGRLITIEGISGAGKSVQLERLSAHLRRRGVPVVTTCDPGAVINGRSLNDLWLSDGLRGVSADAELVEYAAAQARQVREVVAPLLEAGYNVLAERHFSLVAAYFDCACGVDWKLLGGLREMADAGLRPDLTFVLDVDVETALACSSDYRVRKLVEASPSERASVIAFLEGVRTAFLTVVTETYAPVSFVSTARSIKATHREIVAEVDALLASAPRPTPDVLTPGSPEDFERLLQTTLAVRQEWGTALTPEMIHA
jgi:dTMP kinase